MAVTVIVLVNPAIEIGALSVKDSRERMYPFSIVFLSNYLLKKGVPCKVFDLNITTETELLEYVEKNKPELVGFTSATENRFTTVRLIKKTKQASPQSITIAGGRFFTPLAKQAIDKIPELDIVCRGEGEETLLEITQNLKDYSKILGITYRQNGKTIENPDRPTQWNIDPLALDYHYLPEGYPPTVLMRNFEHENIRAAPILVGRNCPHQCVFCTFHMFPYRVRTLENVFKEIDYIINTYGIKWFMFTDPSFCDKPDYVRKLCQKLINEKYNIKWYAEVRVDMPLDLLELMAKAGCVSVDYSFESASPRVLKQLKKDIKPALVKNFAKTCKKLGLRSWIFSIISCPGERKEDAEKTLDLIDYLLKLDGADREINIGTSIMKIYPGTELETIAKKRGILPEEFNWFDETYQSPFPWKIDKNLPDYVEHLTPEYIIEFIDEVNLRTFKHRNTPTTLIKKTMKQLATNPTKTVEKIRDRLRLLTHRRGAPHG